MDFASIIENLNRQVTTLQERVKASWKKRTRALRQENAILREEITKLRQENDRLKERLGLKSR